MQALPRYDFVTFSSISYTELHSLTVMLSRLLIIYMAFLGICKSQRHLGYGTATALLHCNSNTKRTRAPAGGACSTFTPWHHALPPPQRDAVCTLPRTQHGSHTARAAALQQTRRQPRQLGASSSPSAQPAPCADCPFHC